MPALRNKIDLLAKEAGIHKLNKQPNDDRLVCLPEDLYLFAKLILTNQPELIARALFDNQPKAKTP